MQYNLKNIIAQNLKQGMHLKSVYGFVEVVKVNVRAKTTQVFYKCSYGFEPSKPWRFDNTDLVTIKNITQ